MPLLLAVWELVSASTLGWLAAAALPWVIYRLFKRSQQATDWAAMQLLLAAVQRRSRQINFQQWLLLAIRTLAIALVVLAAAEPIYRSAALSGTQARRQHVIVVLDQSYSMLVETEDVTRFERALSAVRSIIESAQPGDALTTISWGSITTNLLGRPVFDRERVLAAVNALEPMHVRANLGAALDAVELAVQQGTEYLPVDMEAKVLFVSDLGQATWTDIKRVKDRWDRLAGKAQIEIADVGDEQRENLSMVNLTIEPKLVTLGREYNILASARYFGLSESGEAEVELLVDGRVVYRQSCKLLPGIETGVHFKHRFAREGSYAIEAVISGDDDCLLLDDRRRLAVDVLPEFRIACIAGFPGAADDVARAVDPPRRDAIETTVMTADVIPLNRLGQLAFDRYAAIFLCSVDRLTERESRRLEHYVQSGGSMAVFLESAELNKDLARLLPVSVESGVAEGSFRFDPLAYEHSIVSPFRGQEAAGLLSTTIEKYVQIVPADRAKTVLRFDSQDPALVIGNAGTGRVAVFALPGTLANRPAWSSFALSPSFLPIVRELVEHLVGTNQYQRRNVQVGDIATVSIDDRGREGLRITDPSGAKTLLRHAQEPASILETSQAGFYTFDTGNDQVVQIAVNLDSRESDLRQVDPAQLPRSSQPATTELQDWGSGMAATSLAPGLLITAFVLLLFESALAAQFGRSWS